MARSFAAWRASALASLAEGQPREAFVALEAALIEPGLSALGAAERADVLGLLAVAIGRIEAQRGSVLARARAAAAAPEDPQALRALALELARTDAARVSDALLERARALAPGELALVLDHAAVLELLRENGRARTILLAAPQASFAVRYHAAFHAIMCGDLAAAEREVAALPDEHPERVVALRGMLARAARVARVSPLDARDLRGWQVVLDGALLLDAGGERAGRYDVVEETPLRAAEAIARVLAVLHATGRSPARVYVLPGAPSAALATALAARAGDLPVEAWSPSSAAPGLVVADDLDAVPVPLGQALAQARAGQVLWAHAACWTRPYPFAADLVSHLYARRESGAAYDARAIEGAEVEASALADQAQVISLALALGEVEAPYAAGLFAAPGAARLRQRHGSPVRSP